jgi:hypothetical protein
MPVAVIQAPASGSASAIAAHPEWGFKAIGDIEHLDDARAAYAHALLWALTGNQANANKAIEIMNAWSGTLTEIKFEQPRRPDNGQRIYDNGKLQAGWGGSLFARAAELIRHTGAGWSAADVARFESMLHNVYLPLTITGWSNGANWLMTFAEATIGIGVFTDNRATFDAGLAYLRDKLRTTIYMPSDGALPISPHSNYDTAAEINALWFNPSQYVEGLQGETLRDISHMAMGLGSLSNAAETARLQGVDVFGEHGARIRAGYERAAGYVNQYLDKLSSLSGAAVSSDWRPAGWLGSTFKVGGTAYKRGWEVAYNHYRSLGHSMPNTERLVERLRPAGVGTQTSWETLTHAR